jgi:hypothetical protein
MFSTTRMGAPAPAAAAAACMRRSKYSAADVMLQKPGRLLTPAAADPGAAGPPGCAPCRTKAAAQHEESKMGLWCALNVALDIKDCGLL